MAYRLPLGFTPSPNVPYPGVFVDPNKSDIGVAPYQYFTQDAAGNATFLDTPPPGIPAELLNPGFSYPQVQVPMAQPQSVPPLQAALGQSAQAAPMPQAPMQAALGSTGASQQPSQAAQTTPGASQIATNQSNPFLDAIQQYHDQTVNQLDAMYAQASNATQANERSAARTTVHNNLAPITQMAQTGALDINDMQTIKKAFGGDAVAMQGLQEKAVQHQQLQTQTQQLSDVRNQFENQYFGGQGLTLQQALTSQTGDLSQLNKFLGQQEANTYNTQLKPMIDMAMGGRGLVNSGANVELQSRALAQLEQARQENIMQAALSGRAQLQSLGRSDTLGNIGYSQGIVQNQADLQRVGITMQFQRELENRREQLARELTGYGGGGRGGAGDIISGGVIGGLQGFAVGGPFGAVLGAGVGAYGGSQGNPSGLGSMGSFFNNRPTSARASQPPGYTTNQEWSNAFQQQGMNRLNLPNY